MMKPARGRFRRSNEYSPDPNASTLIAIWALLALPFVTLMAIGFHQDAIHDPKAGLWIVAAIGYVILLGGVRLIVLFVRAMSE